MESGIWNVFRNNRIEDEEQHRKGINLKKEEMTNMDFLLEAVGIVAAMIYLGLQIYYGIVYGVAFTGIILNAAILILVYVGLTLLARYPERVNNLPKEICSGKIRKYTIHRSWKAFIWHRFHLFPCRNLPDFRLETFCECYVYI